MIQRSLLKVLEARVDHKKALIIFGPRQTGKTTLSKAFANQLQQPFEYFNGDAAVTKSLWKVDNIAALKQSFGSKKMVILDEAQMIEQVGMICKQLIDDNLGIQFIITGSSSFTIADKTQEPLTGRKYEYYLYPISWEEFEDHVGYMEASAQFEERLIYGMYPDVINHRHDAREVLKQLTIYEKGN
jgi:predicted AAA+ superfamily ATPase